MAAKGNQPIRQIIAPTGDWYQIMEEHMSGKENNCVMSRIVAWAIVTGDDIVDHVEGITSMGYGHVEDRFDHWYVCGDDVAPNGKTWRDIFNKTPSFNCGLKRISEKLLRAPEKKKPTQKPRLRVQK